jgi:hypothetical protein
MNQTEYLGYEDTSVDYVTCSLGVDGFLDCSAPGGYSFLQTTELYELLGTIVVIGQTAGSAENFFPFEWKYATV